MFNSFNPIPTTNFLLLMIWNVRFVFNTTGKSFLKLNVIKIAKKKDMTLFASFNHCYNMLLLVEKNQQVLAEAHLFKVLG
jgi:hypothetical protein